MADLPSGTVAFLFTDIDDSTKLWERDQDAMQAAVERHLDLLRNAATTQRGVLYKTIGDGAQVAFWTAGEALAAALVAQRTLLQQSWPDPPGVLRVRMAVHAGEAAPRDGDYLAAPLNRLARLLGIASGGQILLTEAAQLLARDDLPPDTSLRDLGEFPLRGLERPERVFALIHPDLPEAAAPVADPAGKTRHFPRPATPFLGRETQIAAVTSLLQQPEVRLLTLTGPGGIGKTRLGLHAAERLAPAFADGAVFVDLAALRDPALVLPTVAAALGLREAPGRPVGDVIQEYLANRQMLLLLDNFEHLLDAAPAVAGLLSAATAVKILVTSRAPLRLRGEHIFSVPAFALPDAEQRLTLETLAASEAIAFFTERARAIRPDFALTLETAPVVAEICLRLEGLPLAIELAAARIKVIPPRELLARLEQRLPLLTGGPRDAPERQQTLRAAIDWSYDLLVPEEQIVFRRLGVFAGGWTLDAAQAIVYPKGAPDVFDGLAALVDASLVQQDDGNARSRFAFLETIREFALDCLAEGDDHRSDLAERHAGYYLALAEEACEGLTGGRQGEWLLRLDADDANIRAALVWTIEQGAAETALRGTRALWRYWASRGRLVEGRDWLERALALPGAAETSAAVRADAHNALGNLLGDSGEYPRARQHYEEALALRRTLADEEGIAGALNNLGIVAAWLGDYASALTLHEESLTLRKTRDDPFAMALSLSNLGDVMLAQGDFARAREYQEESLRLRELAQDAAGSAYSVYNLGEIARLQGDVNDSARQLADCLRQFAVLGDKIGTAYAEWSLGDLASRAGDSARAGELFARTLRTRLEIGDKRGTIECLEAIGIAAIRAQTDLPGIRLLGAAGAQRAAMACPLPPSTRADHDRELSAAGARLGAAMLETLVQEGALISPEQSLVLGRETIELLSSAAVGPSSPS